MPRPRSIFAPFCTQTGCKPANTRPNENAKPIIYYFEDDEDLIAADFTLFCGVPVQVDAEGWVKVIPLDTRGKGQRQPLELNIYHTSKFIFTSEYGGFTAPLDVGPDIICLGTRSLVALYQRPRFPHVSGHSTTWHTSGVAQSYDVLTPLFDLWTKVPWIRTART